MATRSNNFGPAVGAWASASEKRLLAVIRTSLQDLDRAVSLPVSRGGNMPVVTGNLRRSRLASTTDQPTVGGKEFKDDPGSQITGVIAGFQLGQKFFLGFQAIYARRVEEVRGFVRLAAQQWPQIVRAAASKVEKRVTGRIGPR